MRLWHETLIPHLPRQQLLGQHRECCALRGNGWRKPHRTVNYVFNYSPYRLFLYHSLIMDEMEKRGYHVDPLWLDPHYRGKKCPTFPPSTFAKEEQQQSPTTPIYPEHDGLYLQECLENLKEKKIIIAIENEG